MTSLTIVRLPNIADLCLPLPHTLVGRGILKWKRSLMKFALSRKNLWEHLPRPVKTAVGTMLKVFPQQYLLGSRFRKHLSFVQQTEHWSAEQARLYQLDRLKRVCSL